MVLDHRLNSQGTHVEIVVRIGGRYYRGMLEQTATPKVKPGAKRITGLGIKAEGDKDRGGSGRTPSREPEPEPASGPPAGGVGPAGQKGERVSAIDPRVVYREASPSPDRTGL